MPTAYINEINGINTFVNPLAQQDGLTLSALNVDTDPANGVTKRKGYSTYLNNPDNASVNSLFTWRFNNGTQFYNYRASGSILYYSTQGTGNWTVCGNGTIADGARVGHTVLNSTLIVGDGVNATRHSTDGTSFTNTTSAPISSRFEQYKGRVYAIGTANNLFWSTSGTASDWTTDSSSELIPAEGKNDSIFKQDDQLYITTNSYKTFSWDDYRLIDLATDNGPSSADSIGNYEDLRFWLTRKGASAFAGDKPKYISNAVIDQISSDFGGGMYGTSFDNAQGIVHNHAYFVTVGTITTPFVGGTIADAIIKYDIQHDDWVDYQLADYPISMNTFIDTTRISQHIFGDATGQCYMFDSSTNDNGTAISASMELLIHGNTLLKKNWRRMRLSFNPRCQIQIMVAAQDSFDKDKRWIPVATNTDDGLVEYYFTGSERSAFLFIKIIESSKDSTFKFYGGEIDYEVNKN